MSARQRGIRNSHRFALEAALAIFIGGISTDSLAQHTHDDGFPTAVVRLDNVASVPADTLQVAEDRASDVFRRIGARVRWITVDMAIQGHTAPRFTVVLVSAEGNNQQAVLFDDALGLADPRVHRAHVFYASKR